MFSVCRALLLTWVLSLRTPPSRSLQVCAEWAEGRGGLPRKHRAPGPQHQALCAGWNASRSDHWPQKTIPTGRGSGEVAGTVGACYSSPPDTAMFLMAPHMAPCLGCFQTSNQAGLGAEKLCKIPTSWRPRLFICQMWGWESVEVTGVYYSTINLIGTFLCPDHITLCFSCTYITTSWTDLLTTDKWHWFLLSLLSQYFPPGNELFLSHPLQTSRPVGMPERKHRPRKIFIRSVSRLDP